MPRYCSPVARQRLAVAYGVAVMAMEPADLAVTAGLQ
eukprot:COSAG02_NODE_18576_length_931_cov_1.456731_3_plen_36_part_01